MKILDKKQLCVIIYIVLVGWIQSSASTKPNVVIVLTDDQGYGDLSTHGNPWIQTPHIDELASQSVRLDDYHASPYCVPARAAFLTGRYADRTGIHNVLVPD
ncbi:sulfatase-like hydrolase/transferase, partial [Opitutaceae bacterium]|nr:sulfatase-like hydrolase/transferase [Opitutaceae bacterium]